MISADQISAQGIATDRGTSPLPAVSEHVGTAVIEDGKRVSAMARVSIAPTIGNAKAVEGYSTEVRNPGGSTGAPIVARYPDPIFNDAAITLAAENGYVSTDRAVISGKFVNFFASSSLSLRGRSPLAHSRLSSHFGMRRNPVTGRFMAHSGVDLAAPAGTPVAASGDGVVSKATLFGSYGLYVSLEHGNGTQSRYAHLSRLNVVPGQKVRAGDIIGFVGSTGRSTGPHLHFEIRKNGQAVDPLTALQP